MNRYFKCEVCNAGCTLVVEDDEFTPKLCSETGNDGDPTWIQTNNYELIKKEPDYQAMAERKQFGKFWNKDGDIDDQEYGVLTKINSDYVTYPFIIREDVSYKHFTPMAEPKEIEL